MMCISNTATIDENQYQFEAEIGIDYKHHNKDNPIYIKVLLN